MDHVKAINGELAQKLDIYKGIWRLKADPRIVQEEEKRITHLSESGLVQQALSVGSKVSDFTLWNTEHQRVHLHALMDSGPLVLCWYQGGWNPYCNIHLRYLQTRLHNFVQADATLAVLSPELPDRFLTTKERIQLQFEVLVDFNNQVARQFGIAYREPAAYARQHRLLVVNGVQTNELPMTATYIIDQKGIVQYAFIDPDYRRRAEPDELLEKLYEMKDRT